VGAVTDCRILDSDELNAGLNRLSGPEHDLLAPILGNIENQRQFRKHIRELGHHKVQQLLDKAFPDQTVTIQDFRRSLAYKLAKEQESETAKNIIHGRDDRTVRLGERDTPRIAGTNDNSSLCVERRKNPQSPVPGYC
jgi:hypothetical protein